MEDTDAHWIAQVKAGDRDAFRPLVERYSRGAFRVAYRLMGDASEAEDVVQEAFLRAYRQIHRFDESAGFSTWLYRIATNYALDLLRVRKRRSTEARAVDSEAFQASPAAASGAPTPDRLALSGQLQQHVAAALEELTAHERVAFTLRHLEGQSVEQIGTALGINGNAAKNTIFRAVQKMRRALEPFVASTAERSAR